MPVALKLVGVATGTVEFTDQEVVDVVVAEVGATTLQENAKQNVHLERFAASKKQVVVGFRWESNDTLTRLEQLRDANEEFDLYPYFIEAPGSYITVVLVTPQNIGDRRKHGGRKFRQVLTLRFLGQKDGDNL